MKNNTSMKPIKLICLPFAGGNRYSYREFESGSPASIRLLPKEYPGRGTRLKEPLIRNMKMVAEDLYRQIQPEELTDYAIYGHSMGGLAAFLLTHLLIAKGHEPPLHLFVSGTTGPSSPSRQEPIIHLLEKREFIQEVTNLDGMPGEILENKDLMEYFEPILRADFEATETYVHSDLPLLPIPITVITGTEEPMEEADIRSWQKEAIREVDFRKLPGKHFFIFKYPAEMMAILSEKLASCPCPYQT